MEQFLNTKKYLIIFSLFIILLFMILIYFFITSKTIVPPETTIVPTAEPIPNVTTTNPSVPTISTIVTTPLPFTGVKETEFTETELNEINQERNLKRASPYIVETFTVTYNPAEDIFEVTLVEPKTNSLNDFEIWRKIEYPNISLERFIFK